MGNILRMDIHKLHRQDIMNIRIQVNIRNRQGGQYASRHAVCDSNGNNCVVCDADNDRCRLARSSNW